MGTASVASWAHLTASVSLPVPVRTVPASPDSPDSRCPAGQSKKERKQAVESSLFYCYLLTGCLGGFDRQGSKTKSDITYTSTTRNRKKHNASPSTEG